MSGLSKDSILRMAQEAAGVAYPVGMAGVKIGMSEEHLKHFAALIATAEREACAKVCEKVNSAKDYYGERVELVCAEAIRERSNDAA